MRGVSRADARSIASVLSGRLSVGIVEGDSWSFDFDKSVITYRPDDLVDLTQVEVTANLLHESGHALYSINPKCIEYPHPISKEPRDKVHFIVNAIEDFRIEDKIREFYPYAIDYLPLDSFKTKYVLYTWQDRYLSSGKEVPKFVQYCFLIYSYIAGYDMDDADGEVVKVFEETKEYALSGRYMNNNQEISNMVMKHIYPKIKHWFRDTPDDPPPEMKPIYTQFKVGYPEYNELYADIKKLINPTTEKLKRLLTDNLYDKFNGKYRTGPKIIQNKLYRHQIGDYRLFQRKLDAKAKDYVFALLIDESGSMSGGKTKNAAKSAILFAEVLNNLNIPFGMYGFNGEFHKYKSPQEPLIPKHHRKFELMMEQTNSFAANFNNDAEALYLTGKEIQGYDSKKVIIVLSDGEPAPSLESRERGFGDLSEQVRNIEKKGVEIVGIGINTSSVINFYKTSVVVNNLNDLPKRLAQQLRNKLKIG